VEWQVHVERFGKVQAAESSLEHADNRHRLVRDDDLAADDRRIGGEHPAPVAVSDHGDRRRTTAVVGRVELASDGRVNPEDVEEIVRGESDVGPFGYSADLRQQRVRRSPLCDRLLEDGQFLNLSEFRVDEAGAHGGISAARVTRADDDESVGILDRDGIHQYRREGRPGDCRCGDRAAERSNRRQRRCRMLYQPPHRQFQLVHG
jgi:hypothetical protein